jgi:hypothetical protein
MGTVTKTRARHSHSHHSHPYYEGSFAQSADMRVLVDVPVSRHSRLLLQTRDVGVVPGLFCDVDDFSIYGALLRELHMSGVPEQDLWKPCRGDAHLVANDKAMTRDGRRYKDVSPTFQFVVRRLSEYFGMAVTATRLHWFSDGTTWQPFLDAHADEPNFTVCASFGATRDVAFQDALGAGRPRVVSMPMPNGSTSFFTRDIGAYWRNGVLPQEECATGRLAIVACGHVTQREAL